MAPAFGEDGVDVFQGGPRGVVEGAARDRRLIGVEELEGLLDHAEGGLACALLGLGGEEGVIAAGLHDAATGILSLQLRASVDGGRCRCS